MQQYERCKIVSGSMGSFLDAPNYPTHSFSIETDLSNKKEDRGGINLDYALTCEYISPIMKEKIRKLISDWEATKLPLSHPEIVKWIGECNKHFGSSRAITHIQKFYPEYNKI